MSDSYPLPSYVTQTWVSGDKLFVCFPPTRGDKSHTVQLPATPAGFAILGSLLQERSREGYEPSIGTRAAPVQYDIDKMLLRMTATKVPMGVSGLPEVLPQPKITKLPPKRKQEAKPTLSLADLDEELEDEIFELEDQHEFEDKHMLVRR
jgi:hypothetical protein